MSQPDESRSGRRSLPAMAVIVVAVALVVALGMLTLYAQRRTARAAHAEQSQTGAAHAAQNPTGAAPAPQNPTGAAHAAQNPTKSDCDRPPASAPPKPSGGERPAAQASSPPPSFLTFAACGDSAKTPAKPKSR